MKRKTKRELEQAVIRALLAIEPKDRVESQLAYTVHRGWRRLYRAILALHEFNASTKKPRIKR